MLTELHGHPARPPSQQPEPEPSNRPADPIRVQRAGTEPSRAAVTLFMGPIASLRFRLAVSFESD